MRSIKWTNTLSRCNFSAFAQRSIRFEAKAKGAIVETFSRKWITLKARMNAAKIVQFFPEEGKACVGLGGEGIRDCETKNMGHRHMK